MSFAFDIRDESIPFGSRELIFTEELYAMAESRSLKNKAVLVGERTKSGVSGQFLAGAQNIWPKGPD
jgi:hypothetical protein